MLDLTLPITIGASLSALAAGGSYFFMEKIRTFINPDFENSFLSDSLDFSGVHEDGLTLVGREGSLTRTFVIDGQDYGICTEGEIQNLLKRRSTFFTRVVAKESLKISVITRRVPIEIKCEGTYDNKYLQELHDKWQSQFKKTYRNIHYIVVSQTPASSSMNFFKQGNARSIEKGLFDETCERLKTSLGAFNIKPLKCHTGDFSQHLSFWASLINGQDREIKSFSRHIAERIVGSSIEFDWKAGRLHFDDGLSKRVAAIVSISEWGDESSSKLFRDLYRIGGDITFLHRIEGISKLKSLAILERKESEEGGFLSSITDKAAEEYDVAKQVIKNDDGSLHHYQFSMILHADSEEALRALIQEAKAVFSDYGTECVLEKQAIEHIWRSQLPGYTSFVRKSDLFSHNLSHILTFDKEAVGVKDSDWGKGPLRNFKTINGASYPLNVHVSDKDAAVGHNLVIAPTSSGKTTLIQLMWLP